MAAPPRLRMWILPLVALVAAGCDGDGADGQPGDAATIDVPRSVDGAAADTAPGPDLPPVGDALAPADAAPEVVERGLGIDYADVEVGVEPRYEPTSADWTATPWPTDRLRNADGRLDLSSFPNPDIDVLADYLDYASEALLGWGLNGSIYVQLAGAVDPASLPSAAQAMADPKALVQVVNVTPGSSRYGERMPLEFRSYESGKDPYYLPHTLAIHPVFGFPLAEGETYCALVTRGVKDAQGRHLGRPAAFDAALDADASLAPLVAWLPDSGLLREDLAVATCFTTDRPTLELRQVRAFIETSPVPPMTDVEDLGTAKLFHEYRGHYTAPNFQAGDKPYEEDGDLRFGEDGQPIVQFEEPVRFLLIVPTAYKMPAAGWPVILYAHGTGGDYETCKTTKTSVGPALAKEGFAMICIDQPLHGERGLDGVDPALWSFNVMNPRAGRTNFRQSAIDTMTLTRMIALGGFDLTEAQVGEVVAFDPGNIHFFGHSHGGISGALAIGIEPRIRAAVLSGAGGVLIETVLLRKDPLDFAELTMGVFDIASEDFDRFHPTLSVVQMLVDATDPINYSRLWLHPGDGGTPKHVFVTEGTEDAQTPSFGTDAMCAAAGVPLIDPVVQASPGHELAGLELLHEPVSGNILLATGERRTAGLRQWLGADHFVAFQDGTARARWTNFFRAIGKGMTPVIKP